MNFFAAIGRMVLTFFEQTGRLAVFTTEAVTGCVRPPIYWQLILKQMMRIGFFSLPVVGLTAFFTGGVLALQIYNGASRYGAETFVPVVVLVGITRELGPVIAGLMVAGRVAAAIAAARRGADVILVAQGPDLGGVLTEAGMDQWDLNVTPDGTPV